MQCVKVTGGVLVMICLQSGVSFLLLVWSGDWVKHLNWNLDWDSYDIFAFNAENLLISRVIILKVVVTS
jgi:hypothetical protein